MVSLRCCVPFLFPPPTSLSHLVPFPVFGLFWSVVVYWDLGYPRYVYAIKENAGVIPDCFEIGDDPPRDRTAELRALGFPTRHLGPVQMTTDTAVGVTKRVIVDRGSLLPHLFPAK